MGRCKHPTCRQQFRLRAISAVEILDRDLRCLRHELALERNENSNSPCAGWPPNSRGFFLDRTFLWIFPCTMVSGTINPSPLRWPSVASSRHCRARHGRCNGRRTACSDMDVCLIKSQFLRRHFVAARRQVFRPQQRAPKSSLRINGHRDDGRFFCEAVLQIRRRTLPHLQHAEVVVGAA